jgi:sporulation protein YlmC with PRC-barrel domain
MSNRTLLPMSTALALLMAVPVMAQTTTAPATAPGMGTSHTVTTPGTTMGTTTGMTSGTAGPGASSSTANSTSYLTSDDQIRASKLIGSSVYNDQKQSVGSIDELLMDSHHNVTSAVLSVGGFLGVGSKLVKVPYKNLHVANNTVILPGASKDELQKMPSYEFRAAS